MTATISNWWAATFDIRAGSASPNVRPNHELVDQLTSWRYVTAGSSVASGKRAECAVQPDAGGNHAVRSATRDTRREDTWGHTTVGSGWIKRSRHWSDTRYRARTGYA
ncbi:hypothetical protein GCM10027280_60480 [Micromonospora polyrhachis]